MKLSLMIGGCGAAVMTATMLFAQAEEPKKNVNIVGLESDADNATIAVPADQLGSKPQTMSLSGDAIIEAAKATASAGELGAKVNAANVKALPDDGMVIPPGADIAHTKEEAIRIILNAVGKSAYAVSSNGIDKLTMKYEPLGDGKNTEVEWRKALRLILAPEGYNFTEDGEFVLFGLTGEVDAKHDQLAQERLAANRTPILFTTNESVGGMELRNAIRDVSVKSGVTITTDYMEPADLYVPVMSTAVEGKVTAEEIGDAKEKSVVQQVNVKRTTFDTNGQYIEWRTVLKEILNPHGYGFVEVEGVVRIAKHEKIRQWESDAVAKKPLAARVVRLYHADPEAVVERVLKIKGLLMHPNASLQATRKKDDNTDVVRNLNARIQTSSGQQSGMSDTSSQVFEKLLRPRTVPAIVVYDVEENMDAIEAKIRLFDIKEKQILIEAIIFQLDTDNGDGEMDGVQWKGFENFVPLYGSIGNVKNVAKTFAEMTESGAWPNKDGFKVRRGGQVWMRTDGFDFQTMVQLIRSQDNSKLLSSPMIVVGDHSEAAIQVSDVMPVLEISRNNTYNGNATQTDYTYQWNMIRSGILMWVSPEITESGASVRLTVHPQVVDRNLNPITKVVPGVGEVENYELMMHEMDTRATVPSGATLMFGGLIDNDEVEQEDKVRWLGDIPWIGWLFRSKTKIVTQKNLVIMIRPTILEDADETGFEANALKEAESVSVNSGRNLKKTPLGGPYSIKETKENIMDFYEERVVKPLEDDEEPADGEPIPPAPGVTVISEEMKKPETKPEDK